MVDDWRGKGVCRMTDKSELYCMYGDNYTAWVYSPQRLQ